ncbi:MAG: SPOR domain-containing protein [Candidatus Omnitrophica bacterium]|nr:SPOR domain-containing protein [Candidatus Omnitrophota bacterium]
MKKKLLSISLLILLRLSFVFAIDTQMLRQYFLAGDYQQTIKEAEAILARAQTRNGLDEVYYFLGLSYLKSANYLRAEDVFQIICSEFKGSKFSEEAIIGLGDIAYLKGDFSKAASIYQSLLEKEPNTKLKAGIYYRLSKTYECLNDYNKQKYFRQKLITRYPRSFEANAIGELLPKQKQLVSTLQTNKAQFLQNNEHQKDKQNVSSDLNDIALQTSSKKNEEFSSGTSTTIVVSPPSTNQLGSLDSTYLNHKEYDVIFKPEGGYIIQVGAFSKRENAERLKNKLARQNFPVFVLDTKENNKQLFKVRVGMYATIQQAKEAQRQLERLGYPTKLNP